MKILIKRNKDEDHKTGNFIDETPPPKKKPRNKSKDPISFCHDLFISLFVCSEGRHFLIFLIITLFLSC